ncbi:hypothetical protein PPERSA_00478 [Pseudocohnilembus persalinus]|uniref:Calmodulin n=1 Tax=Pseudocohnilembus persalinus TaxID=266149 RepID=A0A0V0QIL7_PSEPJ|nr:hypothetical protein PPERSA_00478 [Pseudocohnilembus persalinus]|eukprot:KRX01856.1 hypothetical protein PPERSA_00478 [Pseudocohnilembus persalinus]
MQVQNTLSNQANDKVQQIMFHLGRVIQNHQTTPENVFRNFNKMDQYQIDYLEFGVMMRQLDSSLTNLDLSMLFQMFDQYNRGRFSFYDFKNIFLRAELSMDIKLDYKNPVVTNFARQCEINHTDLKRLFCDFLDKNTGQIGLNLNQFSQMMLRANGGLNQSQLKSAFEVFDLQQDNQITFSEFRTIIQRFSSQTRGIYIIIQEIRKHNIDLQLFFNNFNKNDNQIIDITEFRNMVNRIINSFQEKEIEVIFRKFDNLGERFKDIITKYYFEDTVPNMKTDQAIEKLVKEIKRNSLDPQNIFNNYDKSGDTKLDLFEFGTLLRQIEPTMTEKEIQLAFDKFDLNNGLNLEKLFQEIDQSHDQQIDIFEFGTILRKIDPNLKPQEIELAFYQFDIDGDRNITFSEFQETLQKLKEDTAIQISKSKKAIKKIVDLIGQMNIDLKALFKEYDQSGDNIIDGQEFINMMKGFDQTLSDSELNDAFLEFDQDRDGQITFQEFQQCLQRIYTEYGQASL